MQASDLMPAIEAAHLKKTALLCIDNLKTEITQRGTEEKKE